MSEMVPLLDLQGEKNSDLKAFRDFEEPSVLGAAALPHDLIFPWMQKQAEVVKREHGRFQRENERRRDGISYAVERHLFPKILGRKYEYQTFPQFKWQIV